jgi:hypothetical protein
MNRIVTVAAACLLAASTAAQSAPGRTDAPETAAGNPGKVICKSFTRIGSLADRYRTCKTKAEWERERADHQDLTKAYSCRVVDDKAAPCK